MIQFTFIVWPTRVEPPSAIKPDVSDLVRSMLSLRRRLPIYIRVKSQYLSMLGRDLVDNVFQLRAPLEPPRVLVRSIGGDFKAAGQEYLQYFLTHARLQSTDQVLDVGCGVGRMAVPLTGYLESSGSYEGFDIMRNVVAWCSSHITPRFPNFNFKWVQIYNKEYNTLATVQARDFKFPYPDAKFDFVFATSVFTHMYEDDVANYMREIFRVLKPGGRCLLSWFVLSRESIEAMRAGKAALNFSHALGTCFTAWPEIPEAAIAFRTDTVTHLYRQAGFLTSTWYPGHWSSAYATGNYQDFFVAEKPSVAAYQLAQTLKTGA